MPSPYDVPRNVPGKYTRADAFAEYMRPNGSGHPDSGMSDPHPDSSFVDSTPPVDGYKVPDAPSGGYDQRYAVSQGGGAGSMTRLGNSNAEGDYDTSFAGNQGEEDYLKSQYGKEVDRWRKKHRDMTMTNGAGQSFSMQQTPPSMLARAAKERIEFMRSGKATDAVVAHSAAIDKIASDNAFANNAKMLGDADAAKTKAAHEAEAWDAGAPLRALEAKLAIGVKERAGKIEEQRAAIAATPDEAAQNESAKRLLADPSTPLAARVKIIASQNTRDRSLAPDVREELNRPVPGMNDSLITDHISRSVGMQADLDALKATIAAAGTRNGVVTALGGAVDAVSNAIGKGDTDVGEARQEDINRVRSQFMDFADQMVQNGVTSTPEEAVAYLARVLARTQGGPAASKAGKNVTTALGQFGKAKPSAPGFVR